MFELRWGVKLLQLVDETWKRILDLPAIVQGAVGSILAVVILSSLKRLRAALGPAANRVATGVKKQNEQQSMKRSVFWWAAIHTQAGLLQQEEARFVILTSAMRSFCVSVVFLLLASLFLEFPAIKWFAVFCAGGHLFESIVWLHEPSLDAMERGKQRFETIQRGAATSPPGATVSDVKHGQPAPGPSNVNQSNA